MKSRRNILLSTLLLLFLAGESDADGQNTQRRVAAASRRASPSDAELARLRAEVLEKMKESHALLQKLLAIHEENHKKLSQEYEQRRALYIQGVISRLELTEVELALANTTTNLEQVKRWIAEDEVAITEALLRDELLRLPGLAVGGYSESGRLVRFNGGALWSLADAAKIEKFFSQTFGRALPITAYGQTATHDRLRFDHRDAIDVALHPDSGEGRSLLSYLRQAGIPFIAFRGAVPGAATGAHIHIGNPSGRNHQK